jgi:hypothetical protein
MWCANEPNISDERLRFYASYGFKGIGEGGIDRWVRSVDDENNCVLLVWYRGGPAPEAVRAHLLGPIGSDMIFLD